MRASFWLSIGVVCIVVAVAMASAEGAEDAIKKHPRERHILFHINPSDFTKSTDETDD